MKGIHYFENIRGSVMNVRDTRHSFVQLIGEHAVRLTEFTQADRKNDKRTLMATWVRISKLNDEWLTLMCPVLHEQNKQFRQISRRLINDYAEVIGDFIMDANTINSETSRKKVENIARLEGDFYAALTKDEHSATATRNQWKEYTHSIGAMVYNHDIYGGTSEPFYHAAAACIQSGKLLGAWLDSSI